MLSTGLLAVSTASGGTSSTKGGSAGAKADCRGGRHGSSRCQSAHVPGRADLQELGRLGDSGPASLVLDTHDSKQMQ